MQAAQSNAIRESNCKRKLTAVLNADLCLRRREEVEEESIRKSQSFIEDIFSFIPIKPDI